ncbi:hypothetical protein D3C77_208700 [compost metagenome]
MIEQLIKPVTTNGSSIGVKQEQIISTRLTTGFVDRCGQRGKRCRLDDAHPTATDFLHAEKPASGTRILHLMIQDENLEIRIVGIG